VSRALSQPFFARWWTYQRERFPVVAHGLLIAAFSSSAVCFSALLRGQTGPPPLLTFAVAFGTAFLFFLQLRIADEFKDAEEDARYRPYRPVPRGLIRLGELAGLGIIAACIQLALGLLLAPSLILLLACAWAYLALMSKEFFAGEWLKNHPIVYMISHMVIIPIVDFYATACDWWPTIGKPPTGLAWFVAASYFNGIVIEVGRKIRSPADEEPGVNTYSALWGSRIAILVWLGALGATAACAVLAADRVGFLVPAIVILTVLLLAAGLTTWRFLAQLRPCGGKVIEHFAGVWTLLLYLTVGAAPLLWLWWRTHG
jgi:4-hydroxybenzoate polyprenyltransferase